MNSVERSDGCDLDQSDLHQALLNPEEVREMAEVSTPGGVNYMVKEFIAKQDGFSVWADAMGPVVQRIAKGIPKDT